ncbi:MAG: acylphosphatase [Synergistaceae bacterium]|nr:acylphosphatase [Synergistaceae bacterium]
MFYEDKSDFIRVRAFVSGRVQHVGFRSWACEQAERLGLTGTVENLPDGRVEIIFQGKPELVAEMKEKLKRGSPLSIVSKVIFYNERVKPEETFFGTAW